MSDGDASGASRRRKRFSLRYELLGCAIHGHALVGTDAASVRAEDASFAREQDGVRWYRCLRCDDWIHRPLPATPTRAVPPSREEIELPLRGRPLRDRYLLRLIATDRGLRFLVLAPVAIAVFLFARDRTNLHGLYTRVLAGFQSAFGSPINNFGTVELNKLFALTTAELYLTGTAIAIYAILLGLESWGLWHARRWAEYLTFIETGCFIPYEIYELTRSVTALKVIAIVLNVIIVVYLLLKKRLFGVRGGATAEEAIRALDAGWDAVDRNTPPASVVPAIRGSALPG